MTGVVPNVLACVLLAVFGCLSWARLMKSLTYRTRTIAAVMLTALQVGGVVMFAVAPGLREPMAGAAVATCAAMLVWFRFRVSQDQWQSGHRPMKIPMDHDRAGPA